MNALKRGYQKLNAKVGRADETINIGYNQEVDRFTHQLQVMKKLLQNLKEYLKALRTLGLAHAGLNEGIATFYDMTSDLWPLNLKNQENGLLLDKYRNGLDEQLDIDLVAPLNKYMAQYKEMKKRMKERENRRLDFDRLRAEVKSLTVDPTADPAKLQKAQRQCAAAKYAFEELEAELMRDLPALHNDRLTFFDPCFATIVRIVGGYYRQGATLFDELEPMTSHLNPKSIHDRAWVITDMNRTSAKKKKGETNVDDGDYGPPPSFGGGNQYGAQGGGGGGGGYGGGGNYGAGAGGNYGAAPQYNAPAPQSYGAPAPAQRPYPSSGFGAPPSQPGFRGPPPQSGGFPPQGAPPSGTGGRGGRQLPAAPGAGAPAPRGLPSAPGPRRDQAQALYPFQAQSDQELSFAYGETLNVINKTGEWWECELNGRRGLVPGNYLQLK